MDGKQLDQIQQEEAVDGNVSRSPAVGAQDTESGAQPNTYMHAHGRADGRTHGTGWGRADTLMDGHTDGHTNG